MIPTALTIPAPVWLAARARNAVRRPIFIGAVAAGVGLTAVAAILAIPDQQQQIVEEVRANPPIQVDTTAIYGSIALAQARVQSADSALATLRTQALTARPAAVDSIDPAVLRRRDSLTVVMAEVQSMLARVETVPLVSSYRALAATPELAGNARVRALLDTLAEVERERETFGTGGGADPIYVALTSRATEIGRAIQGVAEERRDALRQAIAETMAPARKAAAAIPVIDTLPWLAERDSAQAAVALARDDLEAARSRMAEAEDRLARRRMATARLATPYAMLGAALVFGLVLGFGIALRAEIGRPRAADPSEIERVTGLRVVATIVPRDRIPERTRREADRTAPPFVDPHTDGYQLAYLHVARTGATQMMLTVTGEEPVIAGIVAANLAAIAADEARTTVLVDTQPSSAPAAHVLRAPQAPGFADIVGARREWTDVTAPTELGRHRVIDFVPSGSGADPAPATTAGIFQRDGVRLTRYYDAVFIVASVEQSVGGLPAALPITDVLLTVRVGHTVLADLTAAVEGIREAGGRPIGIVAWNAPPPAVEDPPSGTARPVARKPIAAAANA